MGFTVALRKELIEQWRSHRLLIIAIVLIGFGLASPLMARYLPEMMRLLPEGEQLLGLLPTPTAVDAVDQYTKNLSQFGVLLALLMTMGVVVQEKERGTAALMLVKPLSRGAFLGAKLLALALVFGASLLVAGAAAYYYTLVLFEPLDLAPWLAVNGLLWLFFLVYVALAFFCSTVSQSSVMAGGLAFVGMVVLAILGAIPRLGDWSPTRLVPWGVGLFVPGGEPYWPALWVSVGLLFAAFLGAWLLFERQEL